MYSGDNGTMAEGIRVSFSARLARIGTRTILRLPGSASARLPSRGPVMVEGTMNGSRFRAPLEPTAAGVTG